MEIRIALRVALFLSLVSFAATADVQLGRLIKEQQNNDSISFKESEIEKKDVFSSATKKTIVDDFFKTEEPCYQIDELILHGDFLNHRNLTEIKNKIVGKCLGINGIKKAAVLFQDYYINFGYITTRVIIPSQNLLTKRLKLTVVPGRISDIIITDNDLSKWLLPFSEGDILNIRDIEQGLENIQRTPDVDVQINVLPGLEDGMSKVMINPQRKKKWALRTSYNNYGDARTGEQLISAVGYVFNYAKLSDLFYIAGTGSHTGAYKNFSSYYSFPFGYSDFSFYYSNSKSRQNINVGSHVFDYIGKTKYLNFKTNRMLYRNVNSKISVSTELIRRQYDYTLAGTDLVLQKRDMGNIRLGVNYKRNLTGAAIDSTLTWQHFTKVLGGSETPDMRSGDVSRKSQMMNLNINYVKWLTVLPTTAYYEMNIGAQYSPDNLTLQDQFTIGGRWSVRGFENSNGIYGNKGFFIQNTLNVVTGHKGIAPYIGADYGQIVGKLPSQDLSDKKIMGGIIGVKGRFKSLDNDVSLSSPFLYPDDLEIDKYNLKLNLTYQI